MSDSRWSRLGGRRFDFSVLKGRGKPEYLIAGTLGIIIIGAAYMVYVGLSGDSGPAGPSELKFWCDPNGTPKGCGNEFVVKTKDLPRARNSGDQLNVMRLDCPKCGAKKSSWQERECPNCKKWFVALSTRLRYEAVRRGQGEPTGVRNICPWCKKDVEQWYIEHQPKD